jgi:thymidine kinase
MKAFDKVPHQRLLKKMERYKISETVIKWVESFLNDRKQKVTVNGAESKNHKVTSGIPQGSVLVPIIFVIYINDMPECVDSTTYLFADDTKIFREIKSPNDEEKLQNDLDELQKWSDTWLLKFHPNKCKVLTVSNRKMAEKEANNYHLYDNEGKEVKMEQSDGEKDIGVLVDETISFSTHIQNQINKANSIMGLIRRTYTYLDEQSFKYLFQALVRPHLEYAAAVWSPYKSGEIEQIIEIVQRRAMKQIPSLKNMEYNQRLRKLNMPTLKYRRARGDRGI